MVLGEITSVVIVAATLPFLLKTPDNPDGLGMAVLDDMLTALAADRPQFVASVTTPFFNGLDTTRTELAVSPEFARWFGDMSMQCSLRASQEVYRTLFTTDLRSDMSAVTVPALVIHGDAAPFAPLDICAKRAAKMIPGSRLVVYEGASHGLVATAADRLNEDLLTFTKE